MNRTKQQLWNRFKNYYREFPDIELALDISRMNFADDFFTSMSAVMQKAFIAMAELEKGGIANPDEKRMVGHYWLRNPTLAPAQTITREIEETIAAVKHFADEVHHGKVEGADGPFRNLLVIGIGGSALGPQFVASALSQPQTDKVRPFFFDNTDPDGMDRVLAGIGNELGRTLCLVISKSGGTVETRNGMLEARAAFERNGYSFGRHAVAVTGVHSQLDRYAMDENFLRRFPMWDWVGGRTSELSAVGLLPAALQGFNIDLLLAGARACDQQTRTQEVSQNPAALLALMWFHAGNAKGSKDMVVLPYKDRLETFSRYLQQLVMESLGKERDSDGNVVNQGLVVYGNKGSTDQHAFVQQLRDGPDNFFVTFIEVLQDRKGASVMVEPGVATGDYLKGFLLGTRASLSEKGRETLTLTLKDVTEFSIGVLIALFERAVGLYAALININAYHQPGVEAGKNAAGAVISLQSKILSHLKSRRNALGLAEIADGLSAPEEMELLFKICEQLAANLDHPVRKIPGKTPFEAKYELI